MRTPVNKGKVENPPEFDVPLIQASLGTYSFVVFVFNSALGTRRPWPHPALVAGLDAAGYGEGEDEEDGMAEGEAEEDDVALGDPVRSEVTSGIVPSAEEVVSETVGSVRAGGPEGRESGASSSLSAVTNAHPATAETNALASALAKVNPYTDTRSPLGVLSSSRSGRNTANAPRSTADTAKSVTPTADVSISIIRPTSYAMAALYFRRTPLLRTLLDSPTPMGHLSAGGAETLRGLLSVSCVRQTTKPCRIGSGYAGRVCELLRTPFGRSSQNTCSTHFGE